RTGREPGNSCATDLLEHRPTVGEVDSAIFNHRGHRGLSNRPQIDAILAARLSIRYGAKPPVLRDVQFEIRRSEVLGLVGQSGSGKSTLAMAILGLLDRKRATAEGAIEFDGSDLLRLRERELRGLR